MFTMKPGDVVSMNLDSRIKPHGWMLAFRPEQLNGTGLGRDFYMFNFFEYKVAEALELFDSERRVIINCFNNIYTELQAPDDELTSHMLRLGIGQLLTCCRRFYDRQFDTKNLHSSDLGKRLDKMVDEYLSEGSNKLRTQGPPTVAWCAEQFHLTPSYFGDVVRREMGITPQAFLQTKLIDRAKSLLASQELTINEIAEELGFSGDFTSGQSGSGDLNHGTDFVLHGYASFGHNFFSHFGDHLTVPAHLFDSANTRNHNLGLGVDTGFNQTASSFHDTTDLHLDDFGEDDT